MPAESTELSERLSQASRANIGLHQATANSGHGSVGDTWGAGRRMQPPCVVSWLTRLETRPFRLSLTTYTLDFLEQKS